MQVLSAPEEPAAVISMASPSGSFFVVVVVVTFLYFAKFAI